MDFAAHRGEPTGKRMSSTSYAVMRIEGSKSTTLSSVALCIFCTRKGRTEGKVEDGCLLRTVRTVRRSQVERFKLVITSLDARSLRANERNK